MDIRKIALWIAIFCGAWSVAALAGAEEETTASDTDTSPTVSKTYIESGPFGFLKIEIPIIRGILGGKETAENRRRSFDKQTNLWVLPFLEGSFTSKDPSVLHHLSVLKVPLIGFWSSDTRGKSFVFSDDRNPFWPPSPDQTNIAFMDQPLFCFYDTARLFSDTSVRQGSGQATISPSWQATRSRWLDTLLVSLWEKETWGKGKFYRWKFLDTFLATTLGMEKGHTQFAFRILDASDIGPITGFRYSKDEKVQVIRFIGALDASVWYSRQRGENKERAFLKLPVLGGSLWESKLQDNGWKGLSIGKFPIRGSIWERIQWDNTETGTGTGKTWSLVKFPLLGGSIWESMQWENSQKERGKLLSFLTAPLGLTSVWESEHKQEGQKWTFLAGPLWCAAARSSKEDDKKLTILATDAESMTWPLVTRSVNKFLFTGRGGAPKIALWHQNREDKETSTQQFLRLPLVGPVWAAWEDKEESRWGIFPRLFFWKKFRY